MATFKVVWEIEVEAETPLKAAKKAEKWLRKPKMGWIYMVQEENESDIYSVDLDEEDDNAVLLAHDYEPLIK
jgi:hypothetical protein